MLCCVVLECVSSNRLSLLLGCVRIGSCGSYRNNCVELEFSGGRLVSGRSVERQHSELDQQHSELELRHSELELQHRLEQLL